MRFASDVATPVEDAQPLKLLTVDEVVSAFHLVATGLRGYLRWRCKGRDCLPLRVRRAAEVVVSVNGQALSSVLSTKTDLRGQTTVSC